MIHGVGRNQDGGVERIRAVIVDPPPIYQLLYLYRVHHLLESMSHREVSGIDKDVQAMTKYPNKSCKYPLPLPLPLVRPDQTTATLTASRTGNLAKGT
jgi:hypothetical protein